MAEKRMSTRYRGERPPKRQLSPSPPPPPPPQVHRKPKQKSPSPVERDRKPSKPSQDRKGLPTLSEPQSANLEPSTYQSLAERYIRLPRVMSLLSLFEWHPCDVCGAVTA